jgi:hypothetical protein
MHGLSPRHALRDLTALGVMLLTLACGGGGSSTSPTNSTNTGTGGTVLVLTTLTVSLSSSSIAVGGTSTASASGKDQNGGSIATGTVTWTSGTTSVATVNSSTGVVTAVSAGTSVITASAGGKTGTATITVTASSGGSNALTFKMYSSTSSTGPWSSQTITVTGSDALGLVDPSPLKLSDGTILLYYLMSYITSGDPAASQPGNLWKIGVASSSDNGLTFAHRGVAYTFTSSTTDPFPMVLPNGTIRLLASQGTNVVSVTATDTTGLHFSSTLDAGTRVSTGGVPGALLVGTKNYIYGCGAGILWSQSSDGLAFTAGGTAISGSGIICDPSPIDNGGGSYLMAFKRRPTGATGPSSDTTYMASSSNGQSWTQIATVGVGSVPGLVKDKNGVYRIYVVGF